jgi:hypothetical protein
MMVETVENVNGKQLFCVIEVNVLANYRESELKIRL